MKNCPYLQNSEVLPLCCESFFENKLVELEKKAQEENKKNPKNKMEEEIESVLNVIEINYTSFHKELAKYGLTTLQTYYLYKVIVTFVVNNKKLYLNTKSNLVSQLINEFYVEEGDVLFIFKYYGISVNRTKEMIRTIIGVTLDTMVHKVTENRL